MPTSARGSSRGARQGSLIRRTRPREAGFTLIELVVVVAIVAVAAGLITLSLRDGDQTRLENEAARLAALLEGARTEARVAGLAVAWTPTDDGFRFAGLPAAMAMPRRWLGEGVVAEVIGAPSVTLGPEPILPPQRIVLRLDDRRLELGSDGIAAFAVLPPPEAPAR